MLSRLLGDGNESRAISTQSLFALGDGFSVTTNSGTVVTEKDSLKIEAVYACVRMISDSISTLPVDTFLRLDGTRRPFRPRPQWLDIPESGVTRIEHFQQVLVSLMLNGNSFTRIVRDDQGVAALVVLNPQRVECSRDRVTRRPIYVFENRDVIQAEDMIHITELRLPGEMRGISRIDFMKENLGLAKALEEFAARFFGQGSSASGIIEFPGNLTREQAKDLVSGFEEGHKGLRRSHRPGPYPDNTTDGFILQPSTSYGTQKAIGELLLNDYSRRGFLDGIGLRLPTICVRPGKPNAAASGVFSNIIREPLVGIQTTLTVSKDVSMIFASPKSAVGFLVHAAGLDTSNLGTQRSMIMPGVHATIGEELEALRRVAGERVLSFITEKPNAFAQKMVDAWNFPAFPATRARSLGFSCEKTFDELIQLHIETELDGKIPGQNA